MRRYLHLKASKLSAQSILRSEWLQAGSTKAWTIRHISCQGLEILVRGGMPWNTLLWFFAMIADHGIFPDIAYKSMPEMNFWGTHLQICLCICTFLFISSLNHGLRNSLSSRNNAHNDSTNTLRRSAYYSISAWLYFHGFACSEESQFGRQLAASVSLT